MLRRCATTTRQWRGPVAALLIFLAGASFSILLIGCSDPQKRYQVLSFFFDGVPDPNAPQKHSTKAASNGRGRTFVHKPFADNLCNTCHSNSTDIFARAQVRGDICLDCHSNIPTEHAVMHGPVAKDLGSFCHAAHQSVNEHLLKTPVPKVCTQCHDLQRVP